MFTCKNTYNTSARLCPSVLSNFNNMNIVYSTSSLDFNQNIIVFSKRSYGLFKNMSLTDKKLKQKLINISNFIKSDTPHQKKVFKQKLKIIFYKKLNRFFFRDGRKILMNQFNIKKTLIQKFVTKKIANFIKNIKINKLTTSTCTDVLIQCGLFYSVKDTSYFISNFGVNIHGAWVYNPKQTLPEASIFSVITDSVLLNKCIKKKSHIINNLKRIKFYKYRVKLYSTKKQFTWVSTKNWFSEYTFLTTDKLSNIEFDFKTMSGVILYKNLKNSRLELNYDLSLFMGRSYTWKYLT